MFLCCRISGESLFDQDVKADLTLLSYMQEMGTELIWQYIANKILSILFSRRDTIFNFFLLDFILIKTLQMKL